jgi:hypothetical protein
VRGNVQGKFGRFFVDIEGYVPENSLVREIVILPSFRLVDEATSSQSPVQSLNPSEQRVEANQAAEEPVVAEALSKNALKATAWRIKFKANRLTNMNRWANAVTKAELVLGRPVIVPVTESVTQSGLSSRVSRDSDEMDEETDIHSSEGQGFPENFAPRIPSEERPMTPPPPETETTIEGEEPTLSHLIRRLHVSKSRPRRGQLFLGVEESARSEALRDSTENQRPTHLEGGRGGSNFGTYRPSGSRTRPPLENLGEGLLGDPMAAVMALIPEGFVSETGATSP